MTSNYQAWKEGWKAAMDYCHNSTENNYFEPKFQNPYEDDSE